VNKDDVTKDQILAMIIMGKDSSQVTEHDLEDLH
jgi:hypothetical protein